MGLRVNKPSTLLAVRVKGSVLHPQSLFWLPSDKVLLGQRCRRAAATQSQDADLTPAKLQCSSSPFWPLSPWEARTELQQVALSQLHPPSCSTQSTPHPKDVFHNEQGRMTSPGSNAANHQHLSFWVIPPFQLAQSSSAPHPPCSSSSTVLSTVSLHCGSLH